MTRTYVDLELASWVKKSIFTSASSLLFKTRLILCLPILGIFSLLFLNSVALAQAPSALPEKPSYMIDLQAMPVTTVRSTSPAQGNNSNTFLAPQEFILASQLMSSTTESMLISLLKWKKFFPTSVEPEEAYHRATHFGSWIKSKPDCRNTRALVLERDSLEPVTYKKSTLCTIQKGQWLDPYSNTIETNPKKLQIDHLVPLRNAYLSGAWAWTPEERCWFANNHLQRGLLTVTSATENMTKGHSGPDVYLPPHSEFVCSYIRHWLEVKGIWNLRMDEAEALAVATAFRDYKCSQHDYLIEPQIIQKLQQAKGQIPAECRKPEIRNPTNNPSR